MQISFFTPPKRKTDAVRDQLKTVFRVQSTEDNVVGPESRELNLLRTKNVSETITNLVANIFKPYGANFVLKYSVYAKLNDVVVYFPRLPG